MKVPIGCTERLAFIKATAAELEETFHNGNRKDLLAGLEALPPRVAFAVLATIQVGGIRSRSVARFLQEMA
jgi:hypothetical protein